jgi:HK97 family phage portal protein
MSILQRFNRLFTGAVEPEKRQATQTHNDFFHNILGGSNSHSGKHVTEDSALTLSSVLSAVVLLSESIASLPLSVYRSEGGVKLVAKEHAAHRALRTPNTHFTSFTFIQVLVKHLLLNGNAYALITRRAGGISLSPIEPRKVKVVVKENSVTYQVGNVTYKESDMLHFKGLSNDGIIGLSPITLAREAIGNALAVDEYGARFFSQGGTMSGILEVPGALSDTAFNRLKGSFKEKYHGSKNSHETVVLEEGAKYTRLNLSNEDAQFLDAKRFTVLEVARIFRIPPHLLGELSRATHSNVEQENLNYLTYTLQPWIIRIEQELNKKLFTEAEQDNHFVKFNMSAFLRSDQKSRGEFYQLMAMNGFYTINEVRELEDKSPIVNGNYHFVPVNLQPVERAITPPATNA